MILVDTSVWIEFFAGNGSDSEITLKKLIEQNENICLTDVILLEVLQGIKLDKYFNKIKKYLSDFPIYSFSSTISFINAAQIFRSCRKKGITIRHSLDCLIAQTAIENDLTILHNDKDFDRIAEVTKLSVLGN